MPAQDFANQLTVTVAGVALPPNLAALLVHSVVDDSRTLPDMFVLRFRDTDHVVLEAAASDRHPDRARGVVEREDRAGAAARRRGHRAGEGARRDRDLHDRPRA